MPEAGSPQHARVLQYRELLDALPMDAYTHGCILHPELTTDSMIPKYATAEIRSECCPSEPPLSLWKVLPPHSLLLSLSIHPPVLPLCLLSFFPGHSPLHLLAPFRQLHRGLPASSSLQSVRHPHPRGRPSCRYLRSKTGQGSCIGSQEHQVTSRLRFLQEAAQTWQDTQ